MAHLLPFLFFVEHIAIASGIFITLYSSLCPVATSDAVQ